MFQEREYLFTNIPELLILQQGVWLQDKLRDASSNAVRHGRGPASPKEENRHWMTCPIQHEASEHQHHMQEGGTDGFCRKARRQSNFTGTARSRFSSGSSMTEGSHSMASSEKEYKHSRKMSGTTRDRKRNHMTVMLTSHHTPPPPAPVVMKERNKKKKKNCCCLTAEQAAQISHTNGFAKAA